MSILQRGFAQLASHMERANGEMVIYGRGDLKAPLLAFRGRTEFESSEDSGLLKAVDWIIRREVLVLECCETEPCRGDTITTSDGQVFELLPGNSESTWRWTNSYRTGYRIHTQRRKVSC